MKTPVSLVILDGFGIRSQEKGNAIRAANTPNLDHIFNTYPHTTLKACGQDVGLPDTQPVHKRQQVFGKLPYGERSVAAGRLSVSPRIKRDDAKMLRERLHLVHEIAPVLPVTVKEDQGETAPLFDIMMLYLRHPVNA